MAYCILSCDGGGIRGLLPALVIQKLENDLGLLSNVNLFAGTSAGGLISLGLAAGVSPNQMVSLFENDGSQIFTPYQPSLLSANSDLLLKETPRPLPGIGESWWDQIIGYLWDNLEELVFVKYNNTGLRTLLQGLLPNQPISQLNKPVLVTTFQLDSSNGWLPITISNLPNSQGGNTMPIDAALATSAAPTYFPPYNHPQYGYCADGGLFANNPATVALAMALQAGNALSNIRMLSIGTGSSVQNMPIQLPATYYGPLLWLFPVSIFNAPPVPLISILMGGVSSIDSLEAGQFLGNNSSGLPNFMRVNVPLPSSIALDDWQDVGQIESAFQTYTAGPEWQQVETWVQQNFVTG
jgi:predicted acylesterase/phospholipase RssA